MYVFFIIRTPILGIIVNLPNIKSLAQDPRLDVHFFCFYYDEIIYEKLYLLFLKKQLYLLFNT